MFGYVWQILVDFGRSWLSLSASPIFGCEEHIEAMELSRAWGLGPLPIPGSAIVQSKVIFHQQRKLMGSSAQIGSGVCQCRWQAQVRKVPEVPRVPVQGQVQVPGASSGRFRRVPVCAGGGGRRRFRQNRSRFQKVQEGLGSSRFEIGKTYAHDTATYTLLLLGIPPKLIFSLCNLHYF